jgi:hypothetical protein
MREPKMCKFATHCIRACGEAAKDLTWLLDAAGLIALNLVSTLVCLFLWPFALYLWLRGGRDEQPK